MVALLIILCISLSIALATVLFYAIRWARIIFILEDDLEEAILVHQRTIEVFDSLLNMQMFFDSPDVKSAAVNALENVKMCQIATQRLIYNFTQRSKQKYIRETENEDD